MTRCPQISIIGVPKGGTTSLHCWLEKLPGVSAATPKETFFFMDADNPQLNPSSNFHKNSGEGYAKFFKNSTGKKLDSTTHYFYQRTAIDCFSEAKTKVCVVLRDPVRRLVSYFQYVGITRGAFLRPINFTEFTEHLLSGTMEQLRKDFSSAEEFYTLATGLKQGEYIEYIERWRNKIDPANFRVMFFEELVNDRERFLKELSRFFELEISQDELLLFQVQNESRRVRYPAFNRYLRSFSSFLRTMPFFEMLRKRYHHLQSGEKIEFDWVTHREAIEALYEYYAPFNQKLAKKLEFDLNAWTSPFPKGKQNA